MQSNKHFLTTAALVVVAMFMLGAPSAYAGTATWTNDDGDKLWSNSKNWSTGDGASLPPSASDDAVFPAEGKGDDFYPVEMDSAPGTAKTLDMHDDAVINIPANKILEIGNANGQTSDIDGDIVLQTSSSKLRIMFNHTFRPKTENQSTGRVIGENNSAVIDDNTSTARTLTIAKFGTTGEFIIKGALKIQLSLVNDSRVLADDASSASSNTLTIDDGTFENGTGTYEVNTAGATLEFDETGVTATDLTTDFVVSAGILDIDTSVETDGDLDITGGKIEVAGSGVYFQAEPEN